MFEGSKAIRRALGLLLLLSGGGVVLRSQNTPPPAVFTIVFEEKASSSDGTSAFSKVEVQFAPGAEWHGHFGFNTGGVDERTPGGRYRLRGGLFGLRPDEPMCFGILKHMGTASAGGRTLSGPGAIQMDSAGINWSLREDAARFTRTEGGGVLTCAPVVYQDEDPPEFGLLGPGAYEYGPTGNESYYRFLNFRFSNDELKNLKKVRKVNEVSLTSTDGTIKQWFRSTLTGETPGDETEVTVEPTDYDGWVPEGKLDKPGDPGNRLKIRITAAKKDDPSVKRKATLELSLTKVSMEKGVCLNWPAQGARSDYGLRLLAKENPDLDVLGPDQARTREPVEVLDLVVTAHDFGAWGTLRVTAKDESGAEAKVKVRGEDKAELAIPKDENHNHIADAWETKWAGGLRGQETDDDDSLPTGDGHSGDALSLYEEYRGFRISGGAELTDSGGRPQELLTGYHVRTNPRVKDVFICDRAGTGIGAFRASGLQVHLVKPEECGSNQSGAFNPHVINFNRGAYSKGEQYVLWMEVGNPGKGYAGEAIMKAGPSVPRDCRRVVVAQQIGSPEELQTTLTHELAHACNVKHHGDEGSVDIVRAENLEDHSTETGDGLLVSEGGKSSASGDVHCYMGYTPNFIQELKDPDWRVWDAAGHRYTAKKWKVTSQRFAKYRFCDSKASWELGPAGPPAEGRGDCNHQFCVNHLKH